jgi:hypothetical protein
MPRAGRFKGLAVNVALAIASVALTLLAVEGLLRAFDFRSVSYHPISGFCKYDETLGWRLVPGRSGIFRKREFSARVEQTEQGLRDRPYPYERVDGLDRILVLGDSVVWCWGVEMSDCFTELMEERLPDTEVIAAGVPGYGTAQEVLFYERDLAKFNPDLVLLVFVVNDPSENLAESIRPSFKLRDGELVLTNVPVPRRKSPLKEWLLGNSRLYWQLNYAAQVARYTLKMAREGTRLDRPQGYMPLSPERETEAWEVTRALLERLRRHVRSSGGRLVLVLDGAPPAMTGPLIAFCGEQGIPLLELGPYIEAGQAGGQSAYLPLDPHYSPHGNRIAAEAILRFLREESLLDEPSMPPVPGEAGTP